MLPLPTRSSPSAFAVGMFPKGHLVDAVQRSGLARPVHMRWAGPAVGDADAIWLPVIDKSRPHLYDASVRAPHHRLYSYGLYSDGYVVMAHVVMAYVVMAHIVMAFVLIDGYQ